MSRLMALLAWLLLAWVTAPSAVQAQTTAPVPNHKHYERPENYDAPQGPNAPLAPRLQNLGVHKFPVSTKVERAQLFMNQGVKLAYAFNHAEAARAFAACGRAA